MGKRKWESIKTYVWSEMRSYRKTSLECAKKNVLQFLGGVEIGMDPLDHT